MFWSFLKFEIIYRARRASTWVYFAIFFLMALLTVSVANFGPSPGGKVMANSPYSLGNMYVQLSAFGTIILSAIFGMAILRDFQDNIHQLIFTKPISKWAYLGGRLFGSYAVAFLILAGLPLGSFLGAYMPWTDALRLGPNNLWYHLQPWLFIVSTQVIFCGALFFTIGALSRNVVVVYLQGVVLFGIYIVGSNLVLRDTNNLNTFWPSVFDPIGVVMYLSQTRYWSISDKNTLLFPAEGAFLYNRLLWFSVGAIAIAILFRFFPFSVEALTVSRSKKGLKKLSSDEAPVKTQHAINIPTARPDYGAGLAWAQYLSLTRFSLRYITREMTFWAICVLMLVLFAFQARTIGQSSSSPTYPVTYLMVQAISGSQLFLLIITTIYAGELIWKDRELNFYQIREAVPSPGWVTIASHLTTLTLIQFTLFALLSVLGVAIQASLGYYNFELSLYFKELFLVAWSSILAYTLCALAAHTFIPNKFMAHGALIGINILLPVVYSYGFQDRLYLPFFGPNYQYSEMNGYGHFVQALVSINLYWLFFGLLLTVATLLFYRRGADLSWAARWRNARLRFTRPVMALSLLLLTCFVSSGAYIFYNTHILNTYRDDDAGRKLQAEYEKKYRKYARQPNPKIIDVDLNVNIYPDRRSFDATGKYKLINRTGAPIKEIHVSSRAEVVTKVSFDRPSTLKSEDKVLGYSIYELAQPIEPQEIITMSLAIAVESKGFRNASERNEFAYNGTFFDSSFFPGLGYNFGGEIRDEQRRREFKLPPLEDMPLPTDQVARMTNLFTPDSDWTKFRTTVSTSADQIAIAPGYLQKEWTENGRHYFTYSMGDQLINNFYSFNSGRYLVKRAAWKEIPIEIYYQPGHEYNLDRMVESIQKGFEYYTKEFGPYQFRQYRVIEFPRYRQFAQSFPNTIPFSEGIGFIQRINKEDDLDYVFYVSAHELAHQWWGHQAIGCYAQGSNMMSESLAQYAALMVIEKDYKPSKLRNYLRHELDGYLRGRGAERRKEPPMAYVQSEGYVWYQKGSMVMYALKDYIGEERLNRALKNWLEAVRFQPPPYTNSMEFLAALRKETPPEYQYLIKDMFEDIILFDNKTVDATWAKRSDGKYDVKLKLATIKLHADGLGKESAIPIQDPIDIAIFSGTKEKEKILYSAKHRFTQGTTELDIVVAEEPTRAGIDPFIKLIDRKPDDNTIAVSKR